MLTRILSVAALVALLAGPIAGGGGEGYTIKVKKPKAGQTEMVDSQESSDEQVKIADNNGNVLKEQAEKKGHHYVYKQTILEVKGDKDKPTRLKRQYQKATTTEGGEAKKLSYEGKTVLIEKKGDKYTFRVEGGDEITGDDAKDLDKEFNKKGSVSEQEMVKMMLPAGPVKVGQSWKIDPKVIVKLFEEEAEMELDAAKTKGTGKLLKAYKKDGRQFGVLTITMESVPKKMTKDGMPIAFQPNSKFVIGMTVDGCIDGSVSTHSLTFTGDVSVEALLPSPDQPMFKLNVTAKGKGTEKNVEQ